MGRGFGARGGHWRRPQASDDPRVQNAIQAQVESFLSDPDSVSMDIEAWGVERTTYKRYCQQLGVAFTKTDRGNFRLQKVDTSEDPLRLLHDELVRWSEGEAVATRELLQHVKRNCADLWVKLSVIGVNNCSERKLQQHEGRVRAIFDLSPDWRSIAPKGAVPTSFEYTKVRRRMTDVS